MKRSWNWAIWVGFLVVAAGLLSYLPVFSQFRATRDFAADPTETDQAERFAGQLRADVCRA